MMVFHFSVRDGCESLTPKDKKDTTLFHTRWAVLLLHSSSVSHSALRTTITEVELSSSSQGSSSERNEASTSSTSKVSDSRGHGGSGW